VSDRNELVSPRHRVSVEMLTNMAKLMDEQERLRLFEKYCDIHRTNNSNWVPSALERIAAETGICKSNLYRYLPKTISEKKGGHVPDANVTAKLLVSLLKRSVYRGPKYRLVAKSLELAFFRMRKSQEEYARWVLNLSKDGLLDGSDAEARRP